MRVAIVTESFLPQINGVAMSVLHLCTHLQRRGHTALVIAPRPGPTRWAGTEVIRVPSVPVPGYSVHRVACPWPWLTRTLREYSPDLVHLASPTVLGAQAAAVADRIGSDCIAVYQTDLAAFAARYRLGAASEAVWSWLRWVHRRAARTLAPSRHAVSDLLARGVPRVHLWPRGVDLERFHPMRRDPLLRRELSPSGTPLVGYVGRLAAEKQVDLLKDLHDHHREARIIVVGDGPARGHLERLLPRARFLGFQQGERLAAVYAALDVFVHTGSHETFCQAAQEALASGVPVVAPAAGGLLDLVSDGVNGRLYQPDSAAALRDAVLSLTSTAAVRSAMATAARSSVAGRSWEAVGDDYLDHCAALRRSMPTIRTR